MAGAKGKSKLDLYIINAVRDRRLALGITQEVLSSTLGYDPTYIGQKETTKGRSKYNLYHLNEIAKILRCSPRDFLPQDPIV